MGINKHYSNLNARIAATDVDSADSRGNLPREVIDAVIARTTKLGSQFRHPLKSPSYKKSAANSEQVILEVARVDNGYALELALKLYPLADRVGRPEYRGVRSLRIPPGLASRLTFDEIGELMDGF